MEKASLQFLKNLNRNNHKEWFDQNRPAYELAKQDFIALVAKFLNGMEKKHASYRGIEPKTCIFRINRDVRFSANKSPYKNHLGASINAWGRKSSKAGFYLHLEPGNCFLAAGVWMPPAPHLQAIRQEIDYQTNAFLSVINNPTFKREVGSLDESDTLVNIPKGYPKDHPQAQFLRLKSYLAIKGWSDKEMLEPAIEKELVRAGIAMLPLIDFINQALTDLPA
jgi:uncharacterized protein (TIGR02453 family)